MRLEPYNELLTEEYFLDVGNNIQAHQIVLGSLSEDLPAAIHSFEGKIQDCNRDFEKNSKNTFLSYKLKKYLHVKYLWSTNCCYNEIANS